MMKLYWSPRSRSFSALLLMEETGQPYERVLTDISKGAQKTPEYLANSGTLPIGLMARYSGVFCAYRYFQRRTEDAGISRHQSDGQGAGVARRRGDPCRG